MQANAPGPGSRIRACLVFRACSMNIDSYPRCAWALLCNNPSGSSCVLRIGGYREEGGEIRVWTSTHLVSGWMVASECSCGLAVIIHEMRCGGEI